MGDSASTIRLGNPGPEHLGTGPNDSSHRAQIPLENQRAKANDIGRVGKEEGKTFCASVCYNFKHPRSRKKS